MEFYKKKGLCSSLLILLAFMVSQAFGASGDVNANGSVALDDLVITLGLCCGTDQEADLDADVNGDGKIWLEEAAFILRTVSEESDGDGTDATIGDRTDYGSVELISAGTYSSNVSGVEEQYYEYTSETSDTPAIKVSSGGSLTVTNSKATKSGDTSDRENSGFYGFNAGVLASSSSQISGYSGTGTAAAITMTDCNITTDASGANGAFAFGEDAVVNLDHVTIVTRG